MSEKMELELSQELAFAIETADQAARIMEAYYRWQSGLRVQIKADGTELTDLGLDVHTMFAERYAQHARKGWSVISEESEHEGQYPPPVVCCDPDDGSKDSIEGMNRDPRRSCVAFSLGQLLDERRRLGVITFPLLVTPRMYDGATDMSAWRTINGARTRLWADQEVREGIVYISKGVPEFDHIGTDKRFSTLTQDGAVFKAMATLDPTLGHAFDPERIPLGVPVVGFVSRNTWPHDSAAAAIIAREAGGVATNLDGSELEIDYHGDRRGCVFASNQVVYVAIMKLLAEGHKR